ncbi:receptor-like protein 14 [Mercurialis annua]|uniref:receptor-like protein 14 n=1 Tax=Mercurialis annua TaxID=3986 RepID=UPI00215E758C|nr:receptor-like protein 14 [Mercurialis annua]
MERLLIKFSLCIVLILIQLKGYECCSEKERISLLEIKDSILNSNCEIQDNLDSWVDDGMGNCCDWDRVTCSATSNSVTAIFLNHTTRLAGTTCTLNLSIFHPLQELVSLNLSCNRFYAWTHNAESEGKLSILEKERFKEKGKEENGMMW